MNRFIHTLSAIATMMLSAVTMPLCAIATMMLCVACSDDEAWEERPAAAAASGDGKVWLRVTTSPADDVEIFSRAATIPATDPERAIYTLRVMVFDKGDHIIPEEVFQHYDRTFRTVFFDNGSIDESGNVTSTATEAYDDNEGFTLPVLNDTIYFKYVTATTGADSVVIIPATEATTGQYAADPAVIHLQPSECTVWVLANIGRWENAYANNLDGGVNSLDDIRTRDQLRRFYGRRTNITLGRQRPYMPMVGTFVDDYDRTTPVVDMGAVVNGKTSTEIFADETLPAATTTGKTYVAPSTIDLREPTDIGAAKVIHLDQIVAKVRFNVSTAEGWEFYFDSWTVENMPRYTYIIPHRKDIYDYIQNETYYREFAADTVVVDTVTGTAYPAANILDAIRLNPRTMFYPSGDEEQASIIHNGFGDGSIAGQDWIAPSSQSPGAPAYDDPLEHGFVEFVADANGPSEYNGVRGEHFYRFYAYGNRRGGRGEADTTNLGGMNYDKKYFTGDPTDATRRDGVADATGSNPAYKTLYAPPHASFLVIKGIVRHIDPTTGQRESRSVSYRIALGCNQGNDYNLYRNTCYTCRIRIQGFDQNDLLVTYNEASAEAYNSSVHRRFQMSLAAPLTSRIDCHYDMRYIQFTGGGGGGNNPNSDVEMHLYDDSTHATLPTTATVTFPDGRDTTIVTNLGDGQYVTADGDGVAWLRLSDVDTGEPSSPGYAVHNYADITDYDNTRGRLFTATDETTERTFKLCAEEYVSGYTSPADTRKAWLLIKQTYRGYSDVLHSLSRDKVEAYHYYMAQPTSNFDDGKPDADKEYYIYIVVPIVQYPPKEVTLDGTTLLIERFIEYKMPTIDPRANNTAVDDGLTWGWQRYIPDGATSYNFYNFTGFADSETDGHTNTANISLPHYASTTVGTTAGESWTGIHPQDNVNRNQFENQRYNLYEDFAARYCHDKGDSWYLPSISEMNAITLDYYNVVEGDTLGSHVGEANKGEPGHVFWSSSTYPLKSYGNLYEKYYKPYGEEGKKYGRYSGYEAAWRYAWAPTWLGGGGDIYLSIFGQYFGRPYSVNTFEAMWKYYENLNNNASTQNPHHCAMASCNGLDYLVGFSHGYGDDNSTVDGDLCPRSTHYHVVAVRKKP